MRFLLLASLLLTACASTPRGTDLTLDEKIGQLFVYPAWGTYMAADSAAYQELLRQVRENKVGGITWFVSDVYETAFLTRQLQREARVPLLVSSDLESGIGMRFSDTTHWPWAMAVAATGEPRFAEEMGRIAALEAKAIGVNHILAPVADVNSNPANPVINARSFGEDPHDVARYVAAFVRGVQSQGVIATAKHFPGHGDTHTDTHRSLPVLDVDRARLERVELVPFRAAIEAGAGAVMMGHLSIPALDPAPAPVRPHEESSPENVYTTDESETTRGATVPASLSKAVIAGLLRDELNFDGLVAGDAFDMGALVAHYGIGEAAVRAIEAGTDLILKPVDTDAALAAVKEAVRSGRISEARIDESVTRILRAKRNLQPGSASIDDIFRTVDTQPHRAVAEEIAARAVTLLRESPGILPLRKEQRVVLIAISEFNEPATPVAVAEAAIKARASVAPRSFTIDARTTAADIQPMLEAARGADAVILAFTVRAVSGMSRLRLPDPARALVEQLPLDRTVAVSFGSPYVIRDLPLLRTYLCAYGLQPVMQRAAVAAIYGKRDISGRLPVTIPNLHARGEGVVKKAY